ncbi:MAG: alpha/beta hydrolase [Pseudomonadota bacterium]
MTPLVFVHGFLGGSAQWDLQAPLGQGLALIRLDLPGFGQNAAMAPIDRIADFASWALDDLTARGVERFDLLGHSMGGMIVQDMIRQAPQRVNRLVLYATGAHGVLPGRFETIETSMQRAQEDGAQATARRISATWFLMRDSAEHYEHCAKVAEMAGLDAILAGLATMRDWSGAQYLPDISAETLIIWGDRDRTYNWPQIERLWQGIPQSNLAVLPLCAHAVHLERPALFNSLLAEFLDG